ncbi:MAG: LacI family DNA-binding transcriptional regulator [Actinomycetota bacterium]
MVTSETSARWREENADVQKKHESKKSSSAERRPTVQDVATLAGVSRQTVSNALNAPNEMTPETLARVKKVMTDIGYRPHASARRLRTRTSSTIGIRLYPITNGISGWVVDPFLHQFTERAEQRGMRVLLYTAADQEAEVAHFRTLHEAADVDAFVVMGSSPPDLRVIWLTEHQMPFVTFGRPWDYPDVTAAPFPWVDIDGAYGMELATRELVRRGLRDIRLLGWDDHSTLGQERARGWERVLRDELRMSDQEIAARHHRSPEDTHHARTTIARLFTNDSASPPLEGIVCMSDGLAIGAMMAVREAGHPFLPVTGFDNTPVAETIGLTSIDQQLDEVAAATLDLLMGPTGGSVLPHRSGVDAARHRLITPKLIVRHSSQLAPVDDQRPSPGS